MKKRYYKGLVATAVTATALLIGSQAFASHPVDIPLLDAAGNAISTGSNAAYSAKETCGACHDYNAIERHSFHAQLAANEHAGFNPWAMGNMPSIAAKGKPWVQATGHLGKW